MVCCGLTTLCEIAQDIEMVISMLIFINCASMAAYRPMDGDSSLLNRALATTEDCATAVFTVEVILELAAAGSFRSYFSRSWNTFDFVLVAAGFTKFLPFGNSTSAFKVRTQPCHLCLSCFCCWNLCWRRCCGKLFCCTLYRWQWAAHLYNGICNRNVKRRHSHPYTVRIACCALLLR